MKPITLINTLSLCLLLGSYLSLANAADLPKGVKLANKQTLVRNNGSEPQTLDPTLNQGVPGRNIMLDLYEGLITLGVNGENLPGVTTHWTSTNNNTAFTFYLRKNARWSNDQPVTAHDFVYAFRRLVNPATASNYAYYPALAGVKNAQRITEGKAPIESLGVKAVNDYEFKVFLDKPVPYFVSMMANPSVFPVYAPVIKQWGNQWTQVKHIVSNGAYRLHKHVVNGEIVLVRNKTYWNDKKTVIDTVTFLPIENRVTAMNRFQSKGLDMTDAIPGEYFSQLKRDKPEALKVTPKLCNYFYDLNVHKAPLDNVNVRKALSYAIDRDVITRYITQSGETPAYTLTPYGTNGRPDFTPEWATWTQARRIEKAKALLKAAGVKPADIRISIRYNTDDIHKKIAMAIQQMWKTSLGIPVTIENMEWKTFVVARNQGDFTIARDAWCGDYNEASTFLSLGMSNNANNSPAFHDPAYDQIMQEAAQAPTLKARQTLYTKAAAILSDAMPFAPIFYYVNARLVQPWVGNYNPNILDYQYDKDLYIKKHND